MRILTILLCSSIAFAQPANSQLATARAAADDLVHGRLEQLFNRFNDNAKTALPFAVLQNNLGAGLKQLGAFKQYAGEPRQQPSGPNRVFLYWAEFENNSVDISVVVDPDGKVALLNARPRPLKPPPATSPVQEEAVKLEVRDELDLPATISWPKGNGPFPAVVLLHDMGPNLADGIRLGFDETAVGQDTILDHWGRVNCP